MTNYIIAYDIEDNKIRNKVAKLLEFYGVRLQKSVFSIKCERYIIKKIKNNIESLISDEDSVIVFTLCSGCVSKAKYIGKYIDKFKIY